MIQQILCWVGLHNLSDWYTPTHPADNMPIDTQYRSCYHCEHMDTR